MYLEIRWAKCFELAKKGQVDLNILKATCNNCKTHFDFSFDINQRLRKKGEIFQPEGFQTMKSNSELDIKIPFETNEPSNGIIPIKLVMKFQQFQTGCLFVFLSIFGVFFLTGVWDQFKYDKSWNAYWNLFGGLLFPIIVFFIGKKFFIKPETIIKLNKEFLKLSLPQLNNGDSDSVRRKPQKSLNFEINVADIKQVFVNEILMTVSVYQVVFFWTKKIYRINLSFHFLILIMHFMLSKK